MDALFAAMGAAFASGTGVMLLAATATAIVVVWDWRVALGGLILLHLGIGTILVQVHEAPAFLIVGQLLAILLCVAMLAIAMLARPGVALAMRPGNWLLRLLAFVFIVSAWWFVDPGFALPLLSPAETDILLWIAVCGLLILCLTDNPLFTGVALLTWGVPVYAVVTVLLPGSGLSALVGMSELLMTLACSYLALVQPAPANAAGGLRFVWPLPLARWAILRPPHRPAVAGSEPAAAVALRSTSLPAAEAEAVMEKSA